MRLAVLSLLSGLALAALLGGRLRNLSVERLRWPALTVLAIGLYWVPLLKDVDPAVALASVLVSYLALLVFAGANLHLVGMAVVALGLGLNALVILVNGGMPVDPVALVATGLVEPQELVAVDLGANRQWQSPDDRLAVLADVVPVAPLDEVVSFGDLILAAGLGNVAFRLLHPVGGSTQAPRRGARVRRGGGLLARLSPVR